MKTLILALFVTFSAQASTCEDAIQGQLSDVQSKRLCQRGTGNSPVKCYLNTPGNLKPDDAITLCAGARAGYELAPIQCYSKSSVNMRLSMTLRLCNGARHADHVLNCYNKLINPTDDIAVEQCKNL